MKRKHVIVITAIIVVSVVVSTWSIFVQQKKGLESPEEKLSSLFPSGDIYFCEQTNKPNTFAVGLVFENKSSLVFLWDNMNNRITEIEAAYTPLSEEYLTVYQQILTKNETSTWTGNKIVPCNLCRLSNDTYYVYYYDGWVIHWYYGSAFFYLNNQTIVWDIHVT
ncbi:MAG: hypothetical protein L6265_06195 [Thermoplasmatales archaeon]|nr:hypothetical protein [Candidatus Thermoplasmatota archaeon]MCG2826165.1 hypothetical protein [Thermoplasmatales archaeon]